LGTTITLKRLKQKGYLSLTELYIQLNPSLGACPDFSGNRRVLLVPIFIGMTRTLGGVLNFLLIFKGFRDTASLN
jgi:hypothetical protein